MPPLIQATLLGAVIGCALTVATATGVFLWLTRPNGPTSKPGALETGGADSDSMAPVSSG